MTLHEIDAWFRSFLDMHAFAQDSSQNGIQVQNVNPDGTHIIKAAFAVDACLETIERAAKIQAQLLVVHHGLFWGKEQVLTGIHYRRIKALMDNDMALYASHLPLDADELTGNNYGIARRLCLSNIRPFGLWKGMTIGVQGEFDQSLCLDTIIRRLFPNGEKIQTLLPFGKKDIKKVAIISGGAGNQLQQAVQEKIDLFITGEIGHEQYHEALENGINVIAGGHYQTETVGVSLLAEKMHKELSVETVFIDVPTGL
ncbi:Nif3-like dinuclear metal center hexameric protein [Treponema sp. OMZ 840]|uniref:Nif3-like dinuclear metal center hexameric protein n=1 Tax=Treponema sp. OMZ 840 TaxID=244313 RepID=UPI003D8ABF61